MTGWEPATEAEVAMRDALRAQDQQQYFRVLTRVDLVLPIAGGPTAGWGTWTSEGRTHVLAFTSVAALRASLGENAGATRLVAYPDLAAGWPNQEWWLAVNPGLPIEGYLPAWYVAQLARGDVRLPGRTMGARARLERVESAARAARDGVPGPVRDSGPGPVRDGVSGAVRDSVSGSVRDVGAESGRFGVPEPAREAPSVPVPAAVTPPTPSGRGGRVAEAEEPATVPMRSVPLLGRRAPTAPHRRPASGDHGRTGAGDGADPDALDGWLTDLRRRPDEPDPFAAGRATPDEPPAPPAPPPARSFFEPTSGRATRRPSPLDTPRRSGERATPPSRFAGGQPFPRRRPLNEPVREDQTRPFRVGADEPAPTSAEPAAPFRPARPPEDTPRTLPRRHSGPPAPDRWAGTRTDHDAPGWTPLDDPTEAEALPPSMAEPVSAPPAPRRDFTPIVIEGTVIEARDLTAPAATGPASEGYAAAGPVVSRVDAADPVGSPTVDVAEPAQADDRRAPEPFVTEPSVAEPFVTEPSVAEPFVTEPSVAGLSVAGLSVSEPSVSEPSVSEPSVAGPSVAGPSVGGPQSTAPFSTGSFATGPMAAEPFDAGASATAPFASQPSATDSFDAGSSAPTEPFATGSRSDRVGSAWETTAPLSPAAAEPFPSPASEPTRSVFDPLRPAAEASVPADVAPLPTGPDEPTVSLARPARYPDEPTVSLFEPTTPLFTPSPSPSPSSSPSQPTSPASASPSDEPGTPVTSSAGEPTRSLFEPLSFPAAPVPAEPTVSLSTPVADEPTTSLSSPVTDEPTTSLFAPSAAEPTVSLPASATSDEVTTSLSAPAGDEVTTSLSAPVAAEPTVSLFAPVPSDEPTTSLFAPVSGPAADEPTTSLFASAADEATTSLFAPASRPAADEPTTSFFAPSPSEEPSPSSETGLETETIPYVTAGEPRVEPVTDGTGRPAVEPDFVPANEVEEELLAAAASGNTDGFLTTLLLARVMLPVAFDSAAGTRPGDPGFSWRTETVDGVRYVVVYTSPERLAEHAGGPVDTVRVKFVQLIRQWPDVAWSFRVNPDTPVGAAYPGEQVLALANWAAEVGLGDDPETEPEPPATGPAPTTEPRPDAPAAKPTRPVVMQKAIAASQLAYYLERGYDRVSGFVHRAGELAHLRTPAELFDALGLGHPGSPFSRDAEELYLLRWPAYRPSLYRIPYGGQNEAAMRAMEGWVIERYPFRGNGFAPGESSDVIAEFKVDSARLPHGAELWRVAADGGARLVAVLDTDALLWRKADGA
ncbi:SseB family protein [Micromonospora sp. NBC_01392]|uniref:SseB family protein n=1 Tax=Micromonospora sp. NBC_01392 TaxID=2903588 RepID=UPI0032457E3C